MTHTPHELAEEFPGLAERIHDLKVKDAEFAALLDEYHRVNRAVHRAEALVEPVGDVHETDLRKQRMLLKDRIARMLRDVEAN